MSVTNQPAWRLAVPAIVVIIGFGWSANAAFEKKADKDEVNSLKARVTESEKSQALAAQKQDYMIEILKKVEEKQDFLIREMIRGRTENSPPPSTPPPSTLGR